MRKFLLFSLACAMAGMWSCGTDETPDPKPSEAITLSGTLNIPAQLAAKWSSVPAIGVYCQQAVNNGAVGVANYQAAVTGGAETTEATFACTLTQGEGNHQFYAYAPYSADAGADAASVSGSLKASQTQRGETAISLFNDLFMYASGSFTAGKASQNAAFAFKSLFGVIEFDITPDAALAGGVISEISIDAGAGAVLAGNFTADLTAAAVIPTFTDSQGGKITLTLEQGAGALAAGKSTKVWAVVNAADYRDKTFAIEIKVGGTVVNFEKPGLNIEPNTVGVIELALEDTSAVNLNEDGVFANSYIVSLPNTSYKFDAKVQGNGKTTSGITPAAVAPKLAFVVWETGNTIGGVISSVKLSDDGFVTFTTGEAVDGNALIAVTDGIPIEGELSMGTILWSWHIWATAYSAADDMTCMNAAGQEYVMMGRNLGDWTQPAGTTSSFLGLKYQWGRKDPFIGFNSGGEVVPNACVVAVPDSYPWETGSMDAGSMPVESPEKTIEVASQYPTVFFISGSATDYDWYGLGTGAENRNNNLWGNPGGDSPAKTIYDPCPKGYMVAPIEAFSGFFKTGLNSSYIGESNLNVSGGWNDGWNFITSGSDFSYFPAAGSMNFSSGVIRIFSGPGGASGYYWTSSVPVAAGSIQMRSMLLESDGVMLNTVNRGAGESVRCIKE